MFFSLAVTEFEEHLIIPILGPSVPALNMFVSPATAQAILPEPTPDAGSLPEQGPAPISQSEAATITIVVSAAIALSEFNENIEKNNIKSNFDFI
jgi:hypothetical protein